MKKGAQGDQNQHHKGSDSLYSFSLVFISLKSRCLLLRHHRPRLRTSGLGGGVGGGGYGGGGGGDGKCVDV